MFLNRKKISELLELIRVNHLNYIGQFLGVEPLSSEEKSILKKWGIDWKVYPQKGKVEDAFNFGLLSEILGDSRAKSMTYEQLKSFTASKNWIKLNEIERYSLNYLKQKLYKDIKNLGSKIEGVLVEFANSSFKERRGEYERILKESFSNNIITRNDIRSLRGEIGRKTGDWSRDLDRVVDTVMHEAMNTGRMASVKRKADERGEKAYVYMQVFPGACQHCIKLYLTGGIGSQPRVFDLEKLLKNGTNYGKKTKEWKPVVPPVHPYCRCQSYDYVDGYVWNEEKGLFVPPKVKRKTRSKVKVTIS